MAKIRSSGKFLNFTSQYYNQLAAVVYADIFNYPLTVKEAKLWAIRKVRERYSQEKFDRAVKIVSYLKFIPTIQAVFLTGSVVARNATKNADIDIMVITSPNTLWLTRLLIYNWLKKRVCPNIFLDTDHLEIKTKNLFTAHEVLQAKILFDRNSIEKKWLEKNKWTREYLPNAYASSLRALAKQSPNVRKQIASSLWLLAMTPLELIAFIFQYLYMKPKMTNELVGWGYAFFHPNDLSDKVLEKFEQRLLKYTGK